MASDQRGRKLTREGSGVTLVYYCCNLELQVPEDSQGHLVPVLDTPKQLVATWTSDVGAM